MLALHGAAGLVCCRPVVRLPVVGTLARVHVAQAPAGGLARRGLRCAAMAQDAGCSMNVAVVGAGASGLVMARELLAEGHRVTVFEASDSMGGVWVLDPNTESDPLGADAGRSLVHSSMYESLRTNLPREVMSYLDMPFIPEAMAGRSIDTRRFCGHEEVLVYLQEYARRHCLEEVIRYERQVLQALPLLEPSADGASAPACTGWEIVHQPASTGVAQDANDATPSSEHFDALVVANGHYSLPNLPDPPLPGSDSWPGTQMHAHNYRNPASFAGKVVVVVGAQSSGEDISREVATVADRVYLSAKKWQNPAWAQDTTPFGPKGNMYRRNNLCRLDADGSVEFEGGMTADGVDVVLYCTGYKYNFPFLRDAGVVSVDKGRVEPLYEQVFVPQLAPRLAFIGLPFNVVAFHLFHMQSKWVARALSGRAPLPHDIVEQTEAFYRAADEAGVPGRYVHEMKDKQWDYINRMADYCGDVPHLPAWRREMYLANSKNKRTNPEVYRDHQEDSALVAAAGEEFASWLEAHSASADAAPVVVGGRAE